MKKIFSIIMLSIMITSCGSDSKSVESIIETNNIDTLRKKRDQLTSKQATLTEQIKLIDIAISKLDTIKNYPLVTAFRAQTNKFDHFLEIQGNVATKKNIILYPEYSGLLSEVLVNEGQRVTKGQLLAKIDDGGMAQQLAQMKVQLSLAETTFERQERLWNQKIGSELEYLQSKATYEGQQNAVDQMKSQLEKTSLRAPFSGVIDDIITDQGTVVGAGTSQIIRIVNLDKMYIEAEVPESYLGSIVPGKTAEVFFPVLAETLETRVHQVSNFINPSNRTFKITILIPNNDEHIKPNLTAKIKINDYSSQDALLIPQSIISENAMGEQYIFLLKDVNTNNEAKAKKEIVKTGKTQGDYVEVLNGVSSNDIIVKEGARSLKDGQNVKILNIENHD
jgi:RND family efflux transporter MFP subunit